MFPHWDWPGKEGSEIAIWVYSNLDEIELFVNGQSLGRKEVPALGHLEWNAIYRPGAIEARGYEEGAAQNLSPARISIEAMAAPLRPAVG